MNYSSRKKVPANFNVISVSWKQWFICLDIINIINKEGSMHND